MELRHNSEGIDQILQYRSIIWDGIHTEFQKHICFLTTYIRASEPLLPILMETNPATIQSQQNYAFITYGKTYHQLKKQILVLENEEKLIYDSLFDKKPYYNHKYIALIYNQTKEN